MPTYEYVCKACGEHTEARQSVSDEPLSVCPSCGGPLRKVFGSIGISFKGSGFYRTDSRTASKDTRKAKADATAESKSDTKSDTKADAKSDTKTDSKPKPKSEPSAASAPKSDAKSA